MKKILGRGQAVLPFLVTAMLCAAPVFPEVVADSVKDFSREHGQNSWMYGYWDQSADDDGSYDQTTDFRLLPNFGADPINRLSNRAEFSTGDLWYLEDGRYYTSLWAEGGHPHGSMDLGSYARADHWVVRRWVSTVKGRIEIRGEAGKVMPWGENWGGSFRFLIVAGDDTGYEAEAEGGPEPYDASASVEVGTPVDFLIGPGSAIGVIRFTTTLRALDEDAEK